MLPPLVCPGCRTLTGDQLDVRTIEAEGEVLACACGRRYPIVDGVPIVLADPTSFLRTEIAAITERDLPLATAALLGERGPDDAPYARLLEHVSVYMDAHWGDRAEPADGFALRAVVDKLAARPRVRDAVELGCSAGRIAAELARTADHVDAIDLQFATLRRARHLLAAEAMPYNRRVVGWHYTPAVARAGDLATERVRFICGDAQDPPLVPGMYDRVVALNLLDAVHNPTTLLAVLDGLCAPGGEVILTSPYAWQTHFTVDDGRLGGADPATAIAAHFRAKTYEIEEETDLSWSLRRDARSSVTYRIHYLRARKPAAPRTV